MKTIRLEVTVGVSGTNYGVLSEEINISEETLLREPVTVGQQITRRLELLVVRRDELEHESRLID